jgi:hypothetical protein
MDNQRRIISMWGPLIKKFKTNKIRPSPSISATKLPIGTLMKGNDDNMWIINKTSSGIHRWTLDSKRLKDPRSKGSRKTSKTTKRRTNKKKSKGSRKTSKTDKRRTNKKKSKRSNKTSKTTKRRAREKTGRNTRKKSRKY